VRLSLRFQAVSILAAIFFVLPRYAFAWGKEGHAIVAEVAMHYLSEPAKTRVQEILRKISPADAGNWMDDVRSNDYYNYMRHWHYLDIPKDSVYKPGQGDNLIAALNTAYNDLKKGHPDKEHKQEDVLILFHLIGDMHQPLHTGYPDDKGGNTVELSFRGGGATNLHHLWDTELIQENNITLDTVLALANTLTDEQVKAYRKGNFLSWMYDSRSHLPQVYDFTGTKVEDAYIRGNKDLVAHQLLIGGIRLAWVLETLFGSGAHPQ
jgi:hypothetical protein